VPRAKQRTPELRAHLVEVAVATLQERGVSGFTARGVAAGARTSVPAVYELFGDKSGLLREVFYAGFQQLGARFAGVAPSDDPRVDLHRALAEFRAFARERPALAEVMFSRPFAEFAPGPAELAAGTVTREHLVGCARRAVAAGLLTGDPVDLAHVLLALAQGLAVQERGGWLGTTEAARDRRWQLALDTVLGPR
jgi:AcrR family transcriptional regulator